jgi:hypothetical protein
MTKVGFSEAQSGQGMMGADSTIAAGMLSRLEDSEARRLGVRVAEARTSIARRLRTGAGTLRNIRRQRRKIIPAWLMNAIRGELVRVLEQQMRQLEHEIHLYRQANGSHRTDDLAAIESQMASIRETLNEA